MWLGLVIVPVVLLLMAAVRHPWTSGLLVVFYVLLCLARLRRVPRLLKQAGLALEWLLAVGILCLVMLAWNGGFQMAVAFSVALLRRKAVVGALVLIYVLTFLAVDATCSSAADKRVGLRQTAREAQAIAGMKVMLVEIENWGRSEENLFLESENPRERAN